MIWRKLLLKQLLLVVLKMTMQMKTNQVNTLRQLKGNVKIR